MEHDLLVDMCVDKINLVCLHSVASDSEGNQTIDSTRTIALLATVQ